MILIAAAVGLLYLILYVLSVKKEEERVSEKGNPFYKIAVFLCGFFEKMRIPAGKTVEKGLEMLNPGYPVKKALREYYVKKISLSLEIIFAGTAAALILFLKGTMESQIAQGGVLKRESFAGSGVDYTLTLDGEDTYKLTLNPYILNEQEAQELYPEYKEQLFAVMIGENTDAEHVSKELNLETELEGYPFSTEWESGSPDLVNTLGEVSEVETDRKAVLLIHTEYEGMEWEDEIEITVVPPFMTAEEKRARGIQELLSETEKTTRNEPNYVLPEEYQGEKLSWRGKNHDRSIFVWACVIMLAAVIFFVSDKDLQKDLERRREEIRRDYPDIVQKFVLYMGAGMTARNVFKKLAQDYESDLKQGGAAKAAYEEMLLSYRELLSGVSEGEMYERFGRRTGVQEYIRLGTLLQQNAKKGNSAILDRLKEEAEKSLTEKLQGSRRLGEEASTGLLLPMVLMLLVAMVMIMVPVFMSSMI